MSLFLMLVWTRMSKGKDILVQDVHKKRAAFKCITINQKRILSSTQFPIIGHVTSKFFGEVITKNSQINEK